METFREKGAYCAQLAVAHVPAFAKYRPRMFPSVKDVCSVLSSTSLPELKTFFLTSDTIVNKKRGLHIRDFTETIFSQLYKSFPKVIENDEAAYTVAVIQVGS
jgi:hypothetical protein